MGLKRKNMIQKNTLDKTSFSISHFDLCSKFAIFKNEPKIKLKRDELDFLRNCLLCAEIYCVRKLYNNI